MNFRKLRIFNLAMLAKRGWNLLSKPASLTATVIKAKYHPTATFLLSHHGNNPSFSWRGIWMEKKNILEKGRLWIIGDGTHINVWDDPWLRDDFNF